MVDILLTNDDGYQSAGFYSLLKELKKNFSVTAIAPDTEKSWIGKSISAKRSLEVKEQKIKGIKIFTCDGTPADCVQIGLYNLMKNRPKFVMSGINIGANVGHGRILSSGTIGAAMEASIDGVEAITSSLFIPQEIKKKTDFFNEQSYRLFENAAKITVKMLKIVMNKKRDEEIDLISINMPLGAGIDTQFQITKPFREKYGKLFQKKDGRFVHMNPPIRFENLKAGTDLKAIYDGKISITPISLELVSKNSGERLNKIIKAKW